MAKATFLGTYSTQGMPSSGKDASKPRIYWFVWQDTVANTYLTQKLNSSYDPEGEVVLLPPSIFRTSFTREPRITLIPNLKPDVADYLDKAFHPGQSEEKITVVKGKSSSGDFPRAGKSTLGRQAQELDSQLRNEFSSHYRKYKNGDVSQKEKAKEAFQHLSTIKEGIVPAHKHMFTDFGVVLRNAYLNELAMRHFKRAAELSPSDSHAQFNMARILYELHRYDRSREYAEKALQVEPDLNVAEMLIKSIENIQGLDNRPTGSRIRLSR